jgi:hypothetical protein
MELSFYWVKFPKMFIDLRVLKLLTQLSQLPSEAAHVINNVL